MSIKTLNSKCRLYWCLIEFIDWRDNQSSWYFRPALWTIAPLTFSLVSAPTPPPPLPCVNKYTVYTYTVCNRGIWGHGGGQGGLRQINTCCKVHLQVIFLDNDTWHCFLSSNLSTGAILHRKKPLGRGKYLLWLLWTIWFLWGKVMRCTRWCIGGSCKLKNASTNWKMPIWSVKSPNCSTRGGGSHSSISLRLNSWT